MASTEARPLELVTGVSSGIGFELAKQFADHGCDRAIAAEDDELAAAARDWRRAARRWTPSGSTWARPRASMSCTSTLGSSEKDDPADVARDGFEALMAGEERVVSASRKTKVQGRAGRLMPEGVKAKMHGEQARPGSGN